MEEEALVGRKGWSADDRSCSLLSHSGVAAGPTAAGLDQRWCFFFFGHCQIPAGDHFQVLLHQRSSRDLYQSQSSGSEKEVHPSCSNLDIFSDGFS